MSEPAKATKSDPGSFIVLNGQTLRVRKNETDFTVMAPQSKIQHELSAQLDALAPLSPDMTRARAKDSAERDRLMGEVRRESAAHHVYRVEETGEEIVINDEIILKLRREGAGELEAVMREYSLEYVRRMGDAHVLRLTSASAENPVKTANRIGERDEVESCSPQVMLDLQFHQAQASLLAEQWYLSADFVEHPDVAVDAGIRAPEAWQITRGDPDVVVAVIDDGFDLDHPAFANVRLHPAAYDFAGSDTDVRPGPKNYHGTPVASIAIGTHGPTMHGIAPGCTFLPIRIGFGPTASQVDILDVFRLASKHADVVNCSFGTSPASFERMSPEFRKELTKLCETGGRRGKGLIMVFSAANDDAPTFLAAQDNKNGVLFVGREPFGGGEDRGNSSGQGGVFRLSHDAGGGRRCGCVVLEAQSGLLLLGPARHDRGALQQHALHHRVHRRRR